MTPPRRAVLALGIALLALAAWYAMRPKPDLTLFGPDVQAYRLPGGDGPTGPARIDLSFTRASADAILDVGIDLNGDGAIAEYPTVGGARQAEWIVRDAKVKVTPGPRRFPFEIVDADILTRNNFKLTAVLKGGSAAVLHAVISSFKPAPL